MAKHQQRVSDARTLDRIKERFPGKLLARVDSSDRTYYIKFLDGSEVAVMRREIDNAGK